MLRAMLSPVSALYAAAGARRIAKTTPFGASVPVVCIGNLTLGGAGKTPIARAVRASLGAGAHLISRGYGGRLKGLHRVGPDDAANDVGDEPLLHAADGPAWIARDRPAGARAAIAAGAQALILDDGFQNPDLGKDLSLLVFDAAAGIGNGCVFPAGPLREPVRAGLRRADAVVLLRAANTAPCPAPDYLEGFAGPILAAWLEPAGPPPEGPLIAFAGLARPNKFFETLTAHGAALIDGAAFPDHHPYAEPELRRLAAHAESHGARLITTEKDAVRLPAGWRARVLTYPVRAAFEDPALLAHVLAPIKARLALRAEA